MWRRAVTLAVVAGLVASASACTVTRPGGGHPHHHGDGYVDAKWARARSDAYLRSATQTFSPSSPLDVIAQAERARRNPSYHFDASSVTPAALQHIFDRITNFEDTTDFDVLYLMNLWYGYRNVLPADTRAAIEDAFLGFKYWFTEPTPPGIVDDRWYWSENHRAIFYTDEFLAGQAFPNATFRNDGRTGAQHRADARQKLVTWMDEKVRFGFTEWHSDVYYQKDLTPLLTIVEFAHDGELVQRAKMLLDVFLLDIALHLQKGNFGATHGRSYMKDKSVAEDEDVFAVSKLLFDDTSLPYKPGTDAGATLFARARNYRVPEIIRRIATTRHTSIDREHMNVPLDPLAPIVDNPVAPYGYTFDDPDNVPFWWERGAHITWQNVWTTIETLDRYGLWDSSFFSPFKPLRDIVGNDPVAARTFARQLAPMVNFGLLTEVDTYTYRSDDVMLSSAQDYRPGMFSEQVHAWQATLDEHALVFTTHPKNEPQVGTRWPDDDGYWTGSGSLPRSAQHGRALINIYAPQFVPNALLDAFTYLDYTHAYFPQEYFDEVVRDGNWTFGRKGNGYVALWSYRPVHWRSFDPNVYFTHGLTQPFDLVADGGSDNVWITEVGDASRWKSFSAFRAAVRAAPITVQARPRNGNLSGGFDVQYASPSEGTMQFGWTGGLRVNGRDVALHTNTRIDNPWVRVPFQGKQYVVRDGHASLALDFERQTRVARSR